MGFSAALLALSAVQAISQVGQGYAQKSEAYSNASLIEGKAGLIDIQKGIEFEQYNRAKGEAMSEGVAHTAGAGLQFGGSKLAIALDTQKQLNLDQAIGQFNFDQEKRFTLAEADAVRRGGDRAVKQGYSNAFSTMLRAGASYAMTSVGTVKNTTFDTSYKPLKGSIPKRQPAGYLGGF